ncbi:uroporphyrinogen-III synthase [Ideonella sp. B7]|nr:uroporphyrinogen-III synthase [Ideonella benzenivorans]
MTAAGLARLMVTRPEPQAGDWVRRLSAHGLPAQALPLLAIGPAPDADAVRAMAASLRVGMLVMFVSPNAVQQFLAALPPDWTWPAGVRAGCTGPGTAQALTAAGVPAAAVTAPDLGESLDSEGLWARLKDEDWAGRGVWIVRGDGGRDWFSSTLRAAGAQVHVLQAYVRGTPSWTDGQRAQAEAAVNDPAHSCWLLSSSEAVAHLGLLLPQADWARARALATHPRIVARARQAGFGQVDLIEPGVEGVVRAVGAARAAP